MSFSVAPLFPETSVFIPAYWEAARSEILTQDEADLRYLKFPIGQGTESIPNLIVSGSSTLGITSATAPVLADNSTRVPTTDWVNTAITNASGSTVAVTNTTSASTFFPTFVSASGAGQTLRTDTTGAGSSILAIPNLTVSGTSTLGTITATAPATADNSTRVPTTDWVNTAITNATPVTVSITDTDTSATYYPTFVSASGAGQTLRADTTSTNALKYNPNTNNLFSRDATASSTLTVSSAYTGTGLGIAELELVSGSGSNNMTAELQCASVTNNIYSVFRMIASVINLYAGFPTGGTVTQPGIQINTTAIDTYFGRDTIAASDNYFISRVDTTGFKWGVSLSQVGNYPNPPSNNMPLNSSGAGFMALSTVGILTFGAATYGIQNRTQLTAITPATTLSITGGNLSFRGFNIIYTGTTTTVSLYSYTTIPVNAVYSIAIYNSGSGDVIFNGQAVAAGATRIGGTAGTNTFTIPTLRYAVCEFKAVIVNSFTMYFLVFDLM